MKIHQRKEDEDNDVTVYRTEDVSKVLICVKVTDKEFFFYDAKKPEFKGSVDLA